MLCLAEVLSMAPFSMFLALQPMLEDEWRLSNTETGWISSAYFAGYMVAVPVLSSLTDRVDARTVWVAACVTAGIGAAGFALAADGVWTGAALQAIAGIGLAGTYMPGLKVIADRVSGTPRARHVAFYTTSFTLGSSLSFWIVGALASHLPWQQAVLATAAGPAIGCLLVAGLLRAAPPREHEQGTVSAHWRAVFASPSTLRYVVGYAVHTWELFALRAWLVPFIAFCVAVRGSAPPASIATVAAVVSLVGIPASIAGAELISRIARHRLIVAVMLVSVAWSVVVVPSALLGWGAVLAALCVYNAFISADSAALTSGVLHVAPPASRGTAMAVYSTLGFATASAGTFAVGAVLDLLGGQSIGSWTAAFVLMAAPNLVGAWVLRSAAAGSGVSGSA